MMIHNPTMFGGGNAEEMRQLADHAAQVTTTLAEIYAGRSGKNIDEVREIMAATTFYTAQQAVQHGFADEVVGEVDLAASATPDTLKHLNAPPHVVAAFSRPSAATTTDKEEASMSGTTTPAEGTTMPKPDPNSIESERTRAAGIAEVCAAAGMADLTAGFIAENRTVDEVKAALADKTGLRSVCEAGAQMLGGGLTAAALEAEFTTQGVGADAARTALWDRLHEQTKAAGIVSTLPAGPGGTGTGGGKAGSTWGPVVENLKKQAG
jgi:hypothetical protein